MRAWKLAKQLVKLCGKQPKNSGRRLWQGLCLLSGDFCKDIKGKNLIFVIFARRMSSRVLVPLPISTTK